MREYPWDWILIGLAVALVIGFAWQSVGRCEGACLDQTPLTLKGAGAAGAPYSPAKPLKSGAVGQN